MSWINIIVTDMEAETEFNGLRFSVAMDRLSPKQVERMKPYRASQALCYEIIAFLCDYPEARGKLFCCWGDAGQVIMNGVMCPGHLPEDYLKG